MNTNCVNCGAPINRKLKNALIAVHLMTTVALMQVLETKMRLELSLLPEKNIKRI